MLFYLMITKKAEIQALYRQVAKLHQDHLSIQGVKLPRLENKGEFTKDALVLCHLFKEIGKPVSKSQLTDTVRYWYPETNDVQQARHLGRQKGFFIISGQRGDAQAKIPEVSNIRLTKTDYCLVTMTKSYPGFSGISGHRSTRGGASFGELVKNYGYRCVTCGSLEGEGNLLNPLVTTKLQEGHMDPNKPLTESNTIPQCSECNRAYRDWFIFDGNGRVTDINIYSTRWAKKYKVIK